MDGCWNQTLVVVAALNLSVFQFVNIDKKLSGVKGSEFRILQELSSKMKFQYELVTPDDGVYGNCDDNGVCSGMIGMLTRHEADMAISQISYTVIRAKYIDYSRTYFQEDVTFATKNPDTYEEVNSVFFADPMDRQVWTFLASMLVIFVSVIKIMEYFELMKIKIMSVQTMLEIILRQSVNLDRNENVAMTLLVFVAMTGCTCKLYECMLTSAASWNQGTLPIDTIADMVDAIKTRGYVICAAHGSFYTREIMNSKVHSVKIFAESALNKNFVPPMTDKECMRLLLKEKIALVAPRKRMQMALVVLNISSEMVHLAKEGLFIKHAAVALRKNFPCRDELDKWLNVFVDSGFINKWQNEDMTPFNLSTTRNTKDYVNYIGLRDLKLIFVILISGCLAGFVCLLIERLINVHLPIGP